ncbi:MAG: hypothetical protein ACYSXF_05865 [Planctomycetota bacterium]|jgi:hypothetical protein
MSKPTTKKRPKRAKKLLVRLIGLVVVLGALTALAPTLVNLGLGQGFIRAAAERRINGQVSFDHLQVGWFTPQRIDGLVVTDAGGSEAARLNGSLSAGLFALLFGSVETLEIDLSGRLSGELREDGSTSFQDLLAKPRGDGRGKGTPARPTQLGIPPTTLRISGLTLELRDAVSNQTFVFDDLTGEAAYRAGDQVGLELSGKAFADAGDSPPSPPSPPEVGSINITAEFDGLFDKKGTMTPGLASGRVEVDLRDAPVPLTDLPTVLQQLTLTATSAKLTEQVDVSVEADAIIQDSQPGRLEGQLTLRRPVTADGALDVRLDQVTGRVTGRSVPTALIQPFLSNTPIIASRDIGPTVDIDATFSAATAPVVTLAAEASVLQLAVSGTIDPATRALRGDRLNLAADVAPELFESLTGMSVDRRAGVVLEVGAFAIPPLGRDLARELRSAAASGTLKLTSPTAVSIPGAENWTFAVDDFQVQFGTLALGERLAVRGGGTIEGAVAELDVAVMDLITESGWADVDSIVPIGTASLRGVRPQLLARLWPQRADLIGAAGKGPIDVELVTSPAGEHVNAQLRASRRTDELELRAEWTADTVRVVQGRGTLTATPELMEALQGATDNPLSLVEPATLQMQLEPFELRQVDDRFVPVGPVRALVTVPRVTVDNVPGFVEPLGLHDLTARLTAGFGEQRSIALEGQTKLHRAARDRAASESLGDVQYTLSFPGTGDDSAVPEARLESKNLWLARLEPMLAEKPRAMGPWLGERGAALITFSGRGDSYRAAIVTDFPHLTGEFEGTVEDRTLSVQGRTSKLTLSRRALERRLAPKPAAATEGSPPPAGVTVDADVPLAMNLRSLRLPRAMLAGEPFEPAAVDLDVTVTGGPFIFRNPDRSATSLDQLKLTLHGQDLADGISLSLTGRAGSTGDTNQ